MRKANKKTFIILLCTAIAFIAATLALLFIPEPTPLKVTEKPNIVNIDGEYKFQGKIKNVTANEIVLQSTNFNIDVSVVTADGGKSVYTYKLNYSENVTIQPDEEFDLSELHPKPGKVQSAKINKIIYTPDKTGQTIYGNVVNNGKFSLYALLTGIVGAVLLLISVAAYATEKRNVKRVNNIIGQMRQTFGDGAYYTEGAYGNKAENLSAAAKTTASVFGAIASALFVGIGRYKVYSQSDKNEFIITETSIYMYLNGKFQNITNQLKSAFINPAVIGKKNKIQVKGENKNVYLTVRASAEEKAEILNFLKNIFENKTRTDIIQGQSNGETD